MADLVGPIQFKRGTTAEWATSTIPLRVGEIGVDTVEKRLKLGDGSTLWPSLPWITADAFTVERLEELAEYISNSSAAFLTLAATAKNPDLLITGNVTRDSNQAVTSADVVWPDGTVGQFTALVISTTFPGSVDSYRITYGSPALKTFTQPTITRNSAGVATFVPQIVVS